MNPTKFARDVSGTSVGLSHWKWGSRRTVAVGATSIRSPETFDGHVVFVESTTPCHVRLGGADVAAVETDPVLKPGAVYAFPRAMGEHHIAVRVVDGQPDGIVEYWEADSFIEA